MQTKSLQLKRALSAALFVLWLCLAGMTKMYAYDFSAVCETGQTLYYNIIDAENHYVELTCPGEANWNNYWSDFIRPTGIIILPENVQYNGTSYIVTTIGNYAFCECYELTGNLTIPNTVTSIGDHAFWDCYNFTGSLTIPDSVTSIGGYAFSNCTGFSEVFFNATNCANVSSSYDSPFTGCSGTLTIGTNVERIPAYMFYYGGFTGSLTIPNSVTSIGDYAFSRCNGFTGSLTISNSVTTIGNGAFYECGGFTGSLTIPNSVTSIGNYAFYECGGFTGSLTIPNSVTTIGSGAFYGCSSFVAIIVETGNTIYDSRENCNALIVTVTNELILGCKNSIIPNSVTSIGISAFRGCSGITGSLTIPNSVTSIGSSAFSGCSGITGSLTIPNSVTSIGCSAFSDCSGITEVVFNATNCESNYYSCSPFSGCSGTLTIGANVERIPSYMFYNGGFTGTLTIPNSVTSIGGFAFSGCSGFTGSLTIPNSVTSIGDYAFSGCSGFTGSLTIPNSVISIGDYAFSGCNGFTGSLTISNSVTTIGNGAFSDCSGFTGSLTIPNSVTWIGYSAFSGCSGFTGSLTIPNSVTSIGGFAFSDCSGFTGSLTISNSVTSIEGYAFSYCTGFSEVVFNATNCEDASSSQPPFSGCSGKLTIGTNVERIPACMFKNAGFTEVVFNATNCANVSSSYYGSYDSPFTGCSATLTIGTNVERIPAYMFYNCSGFTGSLTIPNSVTSIGSSAFRDCTGFSEVVFNATDCANVNGSSYSPFTGCSGTLTIGTNVERIPAYMFYNGGFTGSLTIPNSVISIGSSAFSGCSGFSEVIFNATNCEDASSSPFSGCSGTLTIGTNLERIPAYMFRNGGFTGALTIPNSVISIGSSAFSGCSGFTGSLTIPNSVTSIGGYAFSNCTGLSEVIFDATNCGNASSNNPPFSGCSGTLTIGVNVERVPAYMFYNCSGFTGSLTIPNSVTSIGNGAFYGCSGFTGSLTIPNSVTSIGSSAFRDCTGFSEVVFNATDCANVNGSSYSPFTGCSGTLTIGTNVERIPAYMFYNGGFTGSLTIPNSVTSIGNCAFGNCTGFSEVFFNATNCENASSYDYPPFSGCSGTLTIGTNVERIPAIMFRGSGFTGSLTIPDSISSIGYSAFSNCTGFSEVIFNATSCEDASSSPFSGCSATLTIGTNVERIPAIMFNYCSGFTGSLTIPNSVTSIGNAAFSGCSGFTGSLTIPNSVTSIGSSAFYGCNGFTGSLTIPNSVTSIGSSAFKNCIGFSEVFFNATNCANVNNSSSPFTGCSGTLAIGANVERIPAYMFYNCNGFTDSLTIPNSVTSIGSSAFYGCSGFTGSLTIPNSVTSIGGYAFSNCTGFSEVFFNATNCANVSSSYDSPFTGCSGTLTIGTNVERIPAYMFYYGGFTGSLTIPNSVTSIGNYAFSGCSGFTGSLTIPNSVTSIGNHAFYNCTGFTGTLSIGNSVTSIGSDAFNYCSGFTGSLTIPSSVTSIGYSAFDNCSGFDEVVFNATNCANLSYYHYCPFSNCVGKLTIGDNVERIPSYMFYDCSGFTSMSCLSETPPSVGYNAFYNVNHSIPVTVPCGTIGAYQSASGWNQFTNYQEDCAATTITDEICQGDDYLQNGFEIYYPEVGENQYSITLPSSQNIDSIVNLTLTVHPTYYIVEDTTLCNATSFQWHGNTYTASGMYYDSLQTIHGCDSIYALSLEFFNTPLGEFASMIPTNNYPFSSLPITFSWDAVSGAEYYNLYLWNVNEPVPSTPFAGNIYNRSCYVPSLQNHQTYNWYVEAVNTCFSTTSSIRSFSLNIPPTMSVSASSLNFGEVALNNSNTLNLYVSGNALDDTITMQILGEDASMFSFEQDANWNGLTGGLLSVTFSPTTVQYNYIANLVITTGTLTQTVQFTGSLADMFVFNTYVMQDIFEMNSTVPIYGTVMDANNNPASSAEVEVKVTVMNMTRSLFATTEADGHFSVDFVPAYSESGYYTINSGRVGHNSTAVHDDFNIPGMNLVTNDWILWDVVQNETSTGSIVIRNRSQIPLNNIQVTANTLPEGCSFTFQPLTLAGMEEGVLEYSVSGTTPTNGYQEVTLVATSSEGASMNFTVWYRCAEPRGILYASPNNITTTMTKGINKIVDVMLYNNGTGPTGSVYLDLPSVEWLSVVGNDTLPSIAVQDSAYFSLRLSANENTPLVQYTGNIAINCERGDGLLLPYTIMAVSDSTGTLVVDVTDDYTYNGNGQHLAGATVTVKGYYSLETVAIGLTESNGLFTVSNIPEGYYRMSITAPRHAEYQATIQIEGGQTNTQNIYLQYQAITYSWNVVPTETQDEYTFELIVEYETNVPVPVVVIDMPQTFPELAESESFVFDYIITNYGLVDTYEATLYPPTNHPLYDFTPLVTEIDTLHAQTSVVIPCTMTVRTGQRSPLVYAALNGRGDRDGDCPDIAKTEVWSYYYCNGEKVYVKGYKYVQIGSHPCSTPPSGSGGGGSGPGGGSGGGGIHYNGSGGGSGTPPVTTQQQGCDPDPCLPGVQNDLDNCPNNGGTSPNLPPRNPAKK